MPRALILLGLLALALLVASCGGNGGDEEGGRSDEHSRSDEDKDALFGLDVDADPFTGIAPLEVKFTAEPFNASGDVAYIWRFDDGTTSREQSPTHVFRESGTYQVIMTAEDEERHSDSWNLVLAAWPRKYDSGLQRGLSAREQKALTRELKRNTEERRKKYPLRPPAPPVVNGSGSAK